MSSSSSLVGTEHQDSPGEPAAKKVETEAAASKNAASLEEPPAKKPKTGEAAAFNAAAVDPNMMAVIMAQVEVELEGKYVTREELEGKYVTREEHNDLKERMYVTREEHNALQEQYNDLEERLEHITEAFFESATQHALKLPYTSSSTRRSPEI